MSARARRYTIRKMRGLNTNSPVPSPEDLVVARNVILDRPGTARTRLGTRRIWATRTANAPSLNAYEWRNNSGTVFRMTKCNGELESFSLTSATAKTQLETGMSTAGPADMRALNGILFMADQQDTNLMSTGASGADLTQQLRRAAPSTALTPTETGAAAATGFGTGTFRVAYSLYNPTLGDETPSRSYESVTKANANTGIRFTSPADPGAGYTTFYWYRTKAGETGPFYRVGSSTSYAATIDLTVIDTDIDAGPGSYPKSTLHNDQGEITAAVPAAAIFCEVNAGVLWLGNTAAAPLRVFAAKIAEPTNFSVTSLAAAPAYHHDLLEGQGHRFMGMNDLNGSLVCFKDFSITVKNGGYNSDSWTWYVPVDGVGCIARWTRAVAPGIGIFFAGQKGVYLFDGARAIRLSDKPDGRGIGNDYRALDFSQVEEWSGIWSEEMRAYLLAVTPSGETTPTRIYAYFYDTGEWGTLEFGMGLTGITCMGLITNSDSEPTVFLGTSDGYAIEMDYATQTDGPISGTVTGTATASAATTLTDTAAAFYTTGDGLTGLVVTVRHSATSYESRVIASNTATVITVASAWTTNPAVGARYFIGAIRTTLALGGFDANDAGEKRWHRINYAWTLRTHTTPVRCGFTLDDNVVPSYSGDENTMGDVRGSAGVNDRAVECGAYLDIIGTSAPIELKTLEYEWAFMRTRNPAA